MTTIKLPIDCNLSQTSLQEAARLAGCTLGITIRCHPSQQSTAKELYTQQGETIKGNPLAPVLNFIFDSRMDIHAWDLEVGDVVVWTPG